MGTTRYFVIKAAKTRIGAQKSDDDRKLFIHHRTYLVNVPSRLLFELDSYILQLLFV